MFSAAAEQSRAHKPGNFSRFLSAQTAIASGAYLTIGAVGLSREIASRVFPVLNDHEVPRLFVHRRRRMHCSREQRLYIITRDGLLGVFTDTSSRPYGFSNVHCSPQSATFLAYTIEQRSELKTVFLV